MDKIKKYIERFFRHAGIQGAYDMSMSEWRELSSYAATDANSAVSTAFLYGYAKGHRAALAETKKGGDAA